MTDSLSQGRPPLVLIINDQEWSTRSLESILAPNGYAVLRAYTAGKGMERARSAQPDIIVVDLNLPDADGFSLCRSLRAEPGLSRTPIVVTTSGHPSRHERLEALRAGAWEYLGHPLDAEEILLRFNTFARAKLEADRAREEGLLDQLTGLYNLQGLARRAREMGSQAFRHGGALACVVFAPDAATDEDAPEVVLSAVERVGNALRSFGRVSDAIGRVGDTEFAVFAPDTDAEGAERLTRRLAEALEREGTRVHLRSGYHAVRDFREASVEPVDMLVRASNALREARHSNGGRVAQDVLTTLDNHLNAS